MRKTLTILGAVVLAGAVVLVAAIAIPVLADGPGCGRGHHMMGYWEGGPDYCRQHGRGYDRLTDEQRSQLDKLYQKFYDETAQLRDEIRAKSEELNTLLSSPNPDAEKAKSLQKEISDLRAKIAQSQINLRLEERKIAPKAYYGRRHGRGYGHHMGGYGPHGCWK